MSFQVGKLLSKVTHSLDFIIYQPRIFQFPRTVHNTESSLVCFPDKHRSDTHRDQRYVSALLPGRPVPTIRYFRASAARPSLRRWVCACSRRLSVLVLMFTLALLAALMHRESLLPFHFQPLHHRFLIAVLAVAVMPPNKFDPPPEPLHHCAVPRHHKIRHHPEQRV